MKLSALYLASTSVAETVSRETHDLSKPLVVESRLLLVRPSISAIFSICIRHRNASFPISGLRRKTTGRSGNSVLVTLHHEMSGNVPCLLFAVARNLLQRCENVGFEILFVTA